MTDQLFTGTDDADADAEQEKAEPVHTTGHGPSTPVSLSAVLGNVTYAETHAFTVGFAPMFLGLFLLAIAPKVGVTFLALAAAVASMAITGKHVENRALSYIIREPHYAMGGGVLGLLWGLLLLGGLAAFTNLLGVLA